MGQKGGHDDDNGNGNDARNGREKRKNERASEATESGQEKLEAFVQHVQHGVAALAFRVDIMCRLAAQAEACMKISYVSYKRTILLASDASSSNINSSNRAKHVKRP